LAPRPASAASGPPEDVAVRWGDGRVQQRRHVREEQRLAGDAPELRGGVIGGDLVEPGRDDDRGVQRIGDAKRRELLGVQVVRAREGADDRVELALVAVGLLAGAPALDELGGVPWRVLEELDEGRAGVGGGDDRTGGDVGAVGEPEAAGAGAADPARVRRGRRGLRGRRRRVRRAAVACGAKPQTAGPVTAAGPSRASVLK
jgi:hypothetical protein